MENIESRIAESQDPESRKDGMPEKIGIEKDIFFYQQNFRINVLCLHKFRETYGTGWAYSAYLVPRVLLFPILCCNGSSEIAHQLSHTNLGILSCRIYKGSSNFRILSQTLFCGERIGVSS